MSESEALKKELARSRRKTRILEKLLELRCNLRDCPISVPAEKGWATPEGYPLAFSFRPQGHGHRFVVYGHSQEEIENAAQFYSQEKYQFPAVEQEQENIAHIGRFVELATDGYGTQVFEVVGIMPGSGYVLLPYAIASAKTLDTAPDAGVV